MFVGRGVVGSDPLGSTWEFRNDSLRQSPTALALPLRLRLQRASGDHWIQNERDGDITSSTPSDEICCQHY